MTSFFFFLAIATGVHGVAMPPCIASSGRCRSGAALLHEEGHVLARACESVLAG